MPHGSAGGWSVCGVRRGGRPASAISPGKKRRGTPIYLYAYSHEACAPRCFRVDLPTGEVLDKEDQIEAFFRRFRMIEEMPTQMRAALTILVFLAACDHEVLHDFIDHYIVWSRAARVCRRRLGGCSAHWRPSTMIWSAASCRS